MALAEKVDETGQAAPAVEVTSTDQLAEPPRPAPATVPGDYPLGKVRAWSTVAGSFLLTFCVAGLPAAFGVFQDFYTQKYLSNESASTISWIGSMQLFIEMAFAPVAGVLFDARQFRTTVVAGSVLTTFSFFMLSLAKEHQYYQIFLSQGIGMGLGFGLLYLPCATVVSAHFKTRKALALGIVSSSGSLGGIAFSIMLNYFLNGRVGFAWGVRIAAFITLGCCVLGIMLMVEPPRPPRPANQANKTSRASGLWDLPYVMIMWGAFLASLATYFPIFYVQLFAVLHGIDQTLAFYSVAILNASCIFGRIVPNYLADKFGAMNAFMGCLGLCGPVTIAMLACGHPVGLVLFTIFYGFFVGGILSVYLPMIASLKTNPAIIGKRMGISLVPVGVAYLIGSPIISATLGPDLIWWKGIAFAAIVMVVSLVNLMTVKWVVLRRRNENH
ncbi:MFS general substrate transporter [Fomitiporia mediterranea MF3/22]|uniref:MFS general substrate transporter n=1 Tax=Fomitiporia mediterranea (strain MF3/22) TaxID=694068 RepID=UPI0004408D9D|nr:MFS general substrate transporter [Fomitiporia mediterranea MF3/22]EJD00211.1 MFS general substrate transporter [Fomitiporia mediterranea MF3/22]